MTLFPCFPVAQALRIRTGRYLPTCTVIAARNSSSLLGKDGKPTMAIRRETINVWERRAPLAPTQVRRLVRNGIRVLVQPSNRRAFTAQEYMNAGAIIQEDISEASLIVGVKQVPLDHGSLLPNKTYSFFSHTIKAQKDNMPLLDAVLERKVRLIDYEKMLDDKGQRMVAFGQFAGVAGMINILHGLGLRFLALGSHTPFMHIGPTHNYRSVDMARQAIRDAGYEICLGNMPKSIGPLTFVFTGSGNVSSGARTIFQELPCEFVEPAHLMKVATKGDTNKVYGCVVRRTDHIKHREHGGFDVQEFQEHPERYISTFANEIAPYASVIVNGIYYAPNAPRLISIPDAKHLLRPQQHTPWIEDTPGCPTLPHRLVAIADISADPGGSIEFMKECTTIDKPFCLYDAEENMSYEKFDGPGVLICSIDNMPAQLPREATEFFGNLLLPHIYEMIKSNAEEPFESFNVSPVVKNAVIASNGSLAPNYEYIASLREKRRLSQLQKEGSHGNTKKNVLVLGAGFVVPPLIDYLHRQGDINITVVSAVKKEVDVLADQFKNINTEVVNLLQEGDRITTLMKGHHLTVSMLPYKYHEEVLNHCLKAKCNLLTASYCTPALRARAKEIEAAGITATMELGLDPGIDHLLAMECFDDVRQKGGRILSYTSYTGGLPAPEFSENPLRYKFSWSPEAALVTAVNPAKYIEQGKIKEVKAGGDLMLNASPMSMLPGFNLEGYPNRDSTAYIGLYGLEGCQQFIRGTLRYRGYCEAMWGLIQLGLVSTEPNPHLHPGGPEITWKKFLCKQLNLRDDVFTGTLKDAVFDLVGKDKFKFDCINDLELFTDNVPMEKCTTPLATLSNHLAKLLAYRPNEYDVIIMTHEVLIQWPDRKLEKREIRFVVYGQPPSTGYLAMAKTVGVPVAIAAKMMIDQEIQSKGIVLPLSMSIYRPILKRLKQEGIAATERITFLN